MRKVLFASLLVAAVHAAIWIATERQVNPPSLPSAFHSLSFSPLGPGRRADRRDTASREQIERDLEAVAGITRSVRTYTALDGLEKVPALAAEHDIKVILGAWLGKDEVRNKKEIRSAILTAWRNKNVESLMIGNEALLRKDMTVDELISYIRAVKKKVRIPVSTGEVWHVWLKNPRLVEAVDYIAVHILPYWEGVSAENSVAYAFKRYDELRRAYPKKRIVIAEFGWPSNGYNQWDAVPGRAAQAAVIRAFAVEAKKRRIGYNIIEAFDQVWKTHEGSVGQYWGLLDAERRPKFPLRGWFADPRRPAVAATAVAIGFVLTLLGLAWCRPTVGQALLYAATSHALGAVAARAVFHPLETYLNLSTGLMWLVGLGLMVVLIAILLVKIQEIGAILLGHRPTRLLDTTKGRPLPDPAPKVSVHVPACRERPATLRETLDSLAALDYPNFEVLVIVNNTPEEYYWRPIRQHCLRLGSRFKFVHLPHVTGFKAGALNAALPRMAADTEIIAVIDADYTVHRHWLKDLVPAFADSAVAVVQAPQDHRLTENTTFEKAMNGEYAGFFDIGMVQRNEDNAIVTHGTMLLLRRAAFETVGGWSADTIVEDTELGLRLFEHGYQALYTNRRYGWGLLPASYAAYKKQRYRWVYGAVQIFKKHWRHFLPWSKTLTRQQKLCFVTGWTHWLGDALGTLAALANLLWVPVILSVGAVIPTTVVTVPIMAMFVVGLLHCGLLYRARVHSVPASVIPGAAIAALSLQFTVARAVLKGIVCDNLPFQRTDKGKASGKKAPRRTQAETVLGFGLLGAAIVLAVANKTRIAEQYLFAATLGLQSLAFLAAGFMRLLETRTQHTTGTVQSAATTKTATSPVATGGRVSDNMVALPAYVRAPRASRAKSS